jgi:hypothetical protein
MEWKVLFYLDLSLVLIKFQLCFNYVFIGLNKFRLSFDIV